MSRKHLKKNVISLCLGAVLAFGFLPSSASLAAGLPCAEYTGTNTEAQNYSRWSAPVRSYLESLSDGSLMRVQAGGDIKGAVAEYYDSFYHLTSSKNIAEELPIFGGFYAADNSYFLVTGQENPDESADVSVFRITKYDTDWNRLGQAELKDCNTTIPFDAGSVRMDSCGKYLLIRTSHEMYQSDDGYNHQANVTLELDMETMTITDSFTDVSNSSLGYVSHSFNQFLKIEGNRMITLDHGDAYPRSLVLLKYPTDVTTGTFRASWANPCAAINILEFPGAVGQNTTGAAVGGFELSASSYLTAGHSVVQDENNLKNTTRNVFVTAVDKSTSAVTVNWLTSYAEGGVTTTTPQMVKLSDTEFLVLWSRDNTVYYTKVDDKGVKISEIYSHAGNLSDCAPVAANGKIIWYTWKNETVTFYEIDQNSLSQCTLTTENTGHQYESTDVTDGTASLKCTRCQSETQIPVITRVYTWWSADENGNKFTSYEQSQAPGSKLYYQIGVSELPTSGLRDEIEVISSDPSIVSVSELPNTTGTISSTQGSTVTTMDSTFFNGCLTMMNPGTASVTVRSKYNPAVSTVYNFKVTDAQDGEAPKPEPGTSNDESSSNDPSASDAKIPSPADPSPAVPSPASAPSVSKGASVTTKSGHFKVTKAGGSNTAEAAFTGMKSSMVKKLTIPATVTIDGVVCKVTSIAPKAFQKKTKLTKVTIGKHVKSIGKNAFYGCKNLKTITVRSTVLKRVGKNAIKGIHKKAYIKVPKKKRPSYKKLFKAATGFKKTMKI